MSGRNAPPWPWIANTGVERGKHACVRRRNPASDCGALMSCFQVDRIDSFAGRPAGISTSHVSSSSERSISALTFTPQAATSRSTCVSAWVLIDSCTARGWRLSIGSVPIGA